MFDIKGQTYFKEKNKIFTLSKRWAEEYVEIIELANCPDILKENWMIEDWKNDVFNNKSKDNFVPLNDWYFMVANHFFTILNMTHFVETTVFFFRLKAI